LSKGRATVLAKYVKSAIACFKVKSCRFSVVRSAYGEDSPQKRSMFSSVKHSITRPCKPTLYHHYSSLDFLGKQASDGSIGQIASISRSSNFTRREEHDLCLSEWSLNVHARDLLENLVLPSTGNSTRTFVGMFLCLGCRGLGVG
jgi:hypothetical protein